MEKRFSKKMRLFQGKYLSYLGSKGLQVFEITLSTFVLIQISYGRKLFQLLHLSILNLTEINLVGNLFLSIGFGLTKTLQFNYF